MSWWKKDKPEDKELENEICVVCLRSAWDCTCADPDEAQYIHVGDHAKQAIFAYRRVENVVRQKGKA